MRICVAGPGAVGGHLAARLAHGGVSVSVLARGENLAAIRANGLRLFAEEQTIETRVACSDDPAALGPQDCVIVTVKAHALPALVPQLLPLLGAETPVVFAVNGIPWWYHLELARHGHGGRANLDTQGALREKIGIARSIGCTIYSSNEVVSPGVIRHHGGNRWVLGEPDGRASPRIQALSAAMIAAGMEAPVTAAIRTEVWVKLLMNMSVAGLCCITGSTMADIAASEEMRSLCLAILAEGRSIASAHGAVIETKPEQMLPRQMPAHKPSLLQDLERGRPMEIDAIFVAATDFARAAGVATPVFDTLVALLRQRAATARPGAFQARHER